MKKIMKKAAALAAVISLATAPMAFAGGSVGYGDISVYKNETLAGKLSGQNPVEDGALLVCDGKCMLKSEGISLVAKDQSKMAVTNDDSTFNLYVQEGSVDYVITSNARKIAFYTPQGTYTVAEVVFNADSNPVVKGSVVVDASGKTEISVTEGRMVFATADGMKTVDADHKIVLAVAPGSQDGDSTLGLILLGGGALAAALLIANDSGDSGGGAPGPAPTPTPTPTPSPTVKKTKTTTASPNS
ncbi:MAG: hypothetical protein KQH59_21675 [Desulfobulbaceae bacterium]|nr:hypothetical protein [Desulfobulbaceae bacterium]